MTALAALTRGRSAAEALMTDTCAIVRSARGRMSGSTFGYATTDTTVYSGRCRVQAATDARESAVGGQEAVHAQMVVTIPVGAATVAVGDVVTVASTVDPDLDGRTFTVRAVEVKSHATARRLSVEERQA